LILSRDKALRAAGSARHASGHVFDAWLRRV